MIDKAVKERVRALHSSNNFPCPHIEPEYFGIEIVDGCCVVALIEELTNYRERAVWEKAMQIIVREGAPHLSQEIRYFALHLIKIFETKAPH